MLGNKVFLNLNALSCACTDHVLGVLAKALSGEDGLGDGVWSKHESPFVQSLIELFTSRGLLRIERVREELNAWIAGDRHSLHPEAQLPLRFDPARLDASELQLVNLYLENLPPAAFTPSDWGLLVDYLISRYMPADDLQTEAEWLSIRSVFMGKIEANIATLGARQADDVMATIPTRTSDAIRTFKPDAATRQILEWGRARCGENITAVTDHARHRIKRVILAHQEEVHLGGNPPPQALQTQLFDEFATMNRDWRRIALTEVGDMSCNGLIASLKPGTKVRRVEQYVGSCDFCKKINGRVLTVVAADKAGKDWETEVWPGKSNIGRSGSKKKRTDEGLVDRSTEEQWTIPAGTVHPHCRGRWVVLEDARPKDDPDFAKWLEEHFSKHRKDPRSFSQAYRDARDAARS